MQRGSSASASEARDLPTSFHQTTKPTTLIASRSPIHKHSRSITKPHIHNQTRCLSSSAAVALSPLPQRRSRQQRPRSRWSPACSTSEFRSSAAARTIVKRDYMILNTHFLQARRHLHQEVHPSPVPRIRPQQGRVCLPRPLRE